MRVHYFQHVPFENLGSIEEWLKAAKFEISSTRFYQPWEFPNPDNIDFLIALGGPMSVNDEKEHSWLSQEKQYIRNFISMGKPVLGICLGAQLIANALGASVHQNKTKEIGWFPIEWTENMVASAPDLKPTMDVFHWHGETFEIPEGAVRIAQSSGCKNQGFLLGDLVIGLQFHLESTPNSVDQIVKHCGEELMESTFIQNRQDMLKTPLRQYAQANQAMATILERLAGRH